MNDGNNEEDVEDEVTDNDEGAMQMTKSNYYEEDNAEGGDNDGKYGTEGIEEDEVDDDEEYDGTEERGDDG